MKPIDIIAEIQRKEQLNDEQFAHEIGIQRVHWNNIKNYKKHIGAKVVKKLRERYPYLPDSFFLSLLLGEDDQSPTPPRPPSSFISPKGALNQNVKRTLYVMSAQLGRFSRWAFRTVKTRQPFGKAGFFFSSPPFSFRKRRD